VTTATLTHANGATRPAPSPYLEVPLRGRVSQWPRTVVPAPPAGARLLPLVATPRSDTATAGRADKAATARVPWRVRIRVVDGDTVITWAMAATVALVVVDAAIVSYSHIYGLATWQPGTGAETGVQARLLPLSIDGVIAEASLVKLYAARHQDVVDKTRLATFMLSLGIVATVAANVTHGLPTTLLSPFWHTVIMALMSAWPAGAFIGSVEMAMGLVRNKRAIAEGDTDDDTDDTDDDTEDKDETRTPPPPKPPKPRRQKPPTADSDPVAKAIREHPAWKARRSLSRKDKDGIAKALGVTRRTVERRITDIRKAEAATGTGAP
jgi:hypothetical protein